MDIIPVGPEDADLTVVLCHGFGADASDLVPIARELRVKTSVRFLFPNAPHAFPAGWGSGRAWFPGELEEIASFAGGELFHKLDVLDPPELAESGKLLAQTIGPCVSPDRLIVGGFSQGAMVACEALLAAGLTARALVVFSGSLIAQVRWSKAIASARHLAGMPVLQSHGRLDPILPFAGGVALGELLDRGGVDRTFLEFDGGHAIPRELLRRIAAWFDEVAGEGA